MAVLFACDWDVGTDSLNKTAICLHCSCNCSSAIGVAAWRRCPNVLIVQIRRYQSYWFCVAAQAWKHAHVVCLSDTHSKGLFSWESWVPEWMIWRCSLNLHFHSYKERSSWRDAKIIVSVQSYMLCGSKQYNLLNIGRCVFDKVIT